jgi:Mg2+ and Co2+ transporter CorA
VEEQRLQGSILSLPGSADYVNPHIKNPTAHLTNDLGRVKFACGGVVGRIFQGVRARLKFVVQHKGVTAEDSELADTSTALAALIIEKIHTFNEMSLEDVDRWLNCTEMEVQNFATRSHQAHLLNMRRLMSLMKNYVEPFENSIRRAAGNTSTVIGRFFISDTRSDVWAPLWKGCHISNKRGSIGWRRHISKGLERVEQCMQLYRSLLTCQYCSNLQYITIFTILSCPCFYLAHYYGMNFDNMTALASDIGVLHFWGFLVLANAISISILFHFRLFQ